MEKADEMVQMKAQQAMNGYRNGLHVQEIVLTGEQTTDTMFAAAMIKALHPDAIISEGRSQLSFATARGVNLLGN